MSIATEAPAVPACTYQRFTWECRGDGFLWDADHDGWDPAEQDHPCPRCNVLEYLARAKEEAQTTVDWQSGGQYQTGEGIWLNSLAFALEQNPGAVPAALAELGPVDALVPDDSTEDGSAVRRHNVDAPAVDLLGDVPAAVPLGAYWVGDDDIYAAKDETQAVTLANAVAGPGTYTLVDVAAVSVETLDDPLSSDDGPTTLRLLLASAEPGYLAGYEQ
jgi:hypothetical protein